MSIVLAVLRVALVVLALRGIRWAYIAFILLGLLYFPLKVGFKFDPQPCELSPSFELALFSLNNTPHIVLFALAYVITSAQFLMLKWSNFVWAGVITIFIGALVEIAQGVTGRGHCRLRDLIPDTVGVLVGAIVVLLLRRVGWKPRPTWSFIWWQ